MTLNGGTVSQYIRCQPGMRGKRPINLKKPTKVWRNAKGISKTLSLIRYPSVHRNSVLKKRRRRYVAGLLLMRLDVTVGPFLSYPSCTMQNSAESHYARSSFFFPVVEVTAWPLETRTVALIIQSVMMSTIQNIIV